MLPSPFDYLRPETLEAALDELGRGGEGVMPYAGGTELLLVLKMRLAACDALIDLKRIPELRQIALRDGVLHLGAMATHAVISRHPDVRSVVPALAELCGQIANPRVRATGTIGGNLCFAEPSADPPTLLAALDAELHLASAVGARAVPADSFVEGPLETARRDDEILLRIDIPTDRAATRYVRQLNGHRSFASAAASLPAGLEPRVWLGCLAARPVPLAATAAHIAGTAETLDQARLRQIVTEEIAELELSDDWESGAAYRRHIGVVVAMRAIAAAWRASGREIAT